MSASRITVLRETLQNAEPSAGSTVLTYQEFKNWIARGIFLKHLFRFREARFLTCYADAIPRRFLVALLLRLLSRGPAYIQDDFGQRREITVYRLGQMLGQVVRDFARRPALLRQISREVDDLFMCERAGQRSRPGLDLSGSPAYLRTELSFGLRSGGSVGHIAGVLNHIDCFAASPVFLTTDAIPTVRRDLEIHCIRPPAAFWDFADLPSLFFNQVFVREARAYLDDRKPAFIYQRYSLNNYAGLKLARCYSVPFVLEYNGSEIWISRHWGRPFKYEALSERIELLNLRAADLIVVVSRPMKDDLTARGIEANKILVNPNGVDPEKYSPAIDGNAVRERYGLRGKIVIGFIGTFGRWHGAEVLAEAFGRLLRSWPDYRQRLRLLMIGDGVTMPQVKNILGSSGVANCTVLTGLVPQDQGPYHLAACDILVSPHIPNPDGTSFFGSPTKLFEYMAVAKGIVASDLDQIGEVLKHDETAWLVKPGSVESLMLGLKTLVDDPALRNRLGQSARREVVANYTWREHTRRMVAALKERCG